MPRTLYAALAVVSLVSLLIGCGRQAANAPAPAPTTAPADGEPKYYASDDVQIMDESGSMAMPTPSDAAGPYGSASIAPMASEPGEFADRSVAPRRLTTTAGAPDGYFEYGSGADGKFEGELDLELRAMGDIPSVSNNEEYAGSPENAFILASADPLSTFSIDVDTASYSNIRRMLGQGQLPPADAVRIEEMVNYFRYDYPQPEGDVPFAVDVEVSACPWAPKHRLARIGLMGREIETDSRPQSNLVFLIDVSGSMDDYNKLPLVKTALRMLVEQLDANDRIAIVVYAGESRVALPSTTADRKQTILETIESLGARGSTHGSAGIRDAYEIASRNFVEGGVNRVILCTDGDFNVGTTDRGELTDLIGGKAKTGVYLSVLGFGMGNYKDATLEALADQGNGNYGYIDDTREARKTFVEQMSGTLVTIAKDVKIQVDFNPGRVAAYRLIGYENRMLAAEDFKDDQKDAGEIGAGHTVTALYEIVPVGQAVPQRDVDPSKYVRVEEPAAKDEALIDSDELLTVRLRYKQPDRDVSEPLEVAVVDDGADLGDATADFRFAASVAAFGMRLRDSRLQGDSDFDLILELAEPGLADDEGGYRKEFVTLVEQARALEDR